MVVGVPQRVADPADPDAGQGGLGYRPDARALRPRPVAMLADRRVSPIGELPMGASGVPAELGEQLDAARNAAAAGTLSGTRCRQRPRGRR